MQGEWDQVCWFNGEELKHLQQQDECEALVPLYESASLEAMAYFGNRPVFVKRSMENPCHIKVQILVDSTEYDIQLWERGCSIQQHHQKVFKLAPTFTLSNDLCYELQDYTKMLTSVAKYENVGIVQFLINEQLHPDFIEVNSYIQVEHTVTK